MDKPWSKITPSNRGHTDMNQNQILTTGYLRLRQIIGHPKSGIPALLPVSRSTWYKGIQTGRYPKPIKISERCSAWKVSDINRLINDFKK